MSWNVALPANSSQIALSAGYLRTNNTGLQTGLTASTLNGGYPLIPTGGPVAMYFYANAAPSGWTYVNTITDRLLALKDAAVTDYATGGTVGGTWDTGAYQLVYTDIPTVIGGIPTTQAFTASPSTAVTNNPHVHTWSTTRPRATVGILCTKDA